MTTETNQPGSEILTYDKPKHRELLVKSNERFSDTSAFIPTHDAQGDPLTGEVTNMYILKRLGAITTIYYDEQLRSLNTWPITPLQSELLLQQGKLPKPGDYWEDLALLLYDTQGANKKEAQALKQSLLEHRDQLASGTLSNSDLDSRLLIVNPGLEKDPSMPHGVKPIILPGLTQVYPHETLTRTGKNYKFEYGLEHGLPSVSNLDRGNKTLYMPSFNEDIGLRVLYRRRDLDLNSRFDDLANSSSDGRVNLAPQERAELK